MDGQNKNRYCHKLVESQLTLICGGLTSCSIHSQSLYSSHCIILNHFLCSTRFAVGACANVGYQALILSSSALIKTWVCGYSNSLHKEPCQFMALGGRCWYSVHCLCDHVRPYTHLI